MYLVQLSIHTAGRQYNGVLKYVDPKRKIHIREITGEGRKGDSRQRLELMALKDALERMARPSEIVIETTSAYIKTGLDYLGAWKAQGWKKSNGKPLANADLWQMVDSLQTGHKVNVILTDSGKSEKEENRFAKAE